MLFICLSIKLWESDFFLNKGNLNSWAYFGEIIMSGFVLLPFPLCASPQAPCKRLLRPLCTLGTGGRRASPPCKKQKVCFHVNVRHGASQLELVMLFKSFQSKIVTVTQQSKNESKCFEQKDNDDIAHLARK